LNHYHLVPNVFFRRQLGQYLFDEEKARSLLSAHNIPLSVLTSDDYTESKKLASLANTVWRSLDDESTNGAIKRLPFGFFKMLCRACGDCLNLHSIIHRSCDFFRLISDEYKFSLKIKGEEALFILGHESQEGSFLPKNNDYFIMSLTIVLTRWFAWMINEKIKLERVEFQFSAFTLPKDFEAIYHSAVEFNQHSNCIVFSKDFLKKPVVASQDKLPALLINAPHCFLSHYRQDNSTAEQVRNILVQNEDYSQLKLLDISQQLNISTATLTRKLNAENTSFMEIKDRTRKHKAMSLLRTLELPIAEIAYLLGFSEPSAFTRAFKKWTGDSPVEYRSRI